MSVPFSGYEGLHGRTTGVTEVSKHCVKNTTEFQKWRAKKGGFFSPESCFFEDLVALVEELFFPHKTGAGEANGGVDAAPPHKQYQLIGTAPIAQLSFCDRI